MFFNGRYDLDNTGTISGESIANRHKDNQGMMKSLMVVSICIGAILLILLLINTKMQFMQQSILVILLIGSGVFALIGFKGSREGGSTLTNGCFFTQPYINNQEMLDIVSKMEFNVIEETGSLPRIIYNDKFLFLGGQLIPWILIDGFYLDNVEKDYRGFTKEADVCVIYKDGIDKDKRRLGTKEGIEARYISFLVNILNHSFKRCSKIITAKNFKEVFDTFDSQVNIEPRDEDYATGTARGIGVAANLIKKAIDKNKDEK